MAYRLVHLWLLGVLVFWRPAGFHARANDRLNVKDVCVIWGENAANGSYRQARFHSGEVTCFVRFPSAPAGQAFVPRALSNNHLLAATWPATATTKPRQRAWAAARANGAAPASAATTPATAPAKPST